MKKNSNKKKKKRKEEKKKRRKRTSHNSTCVLFTVSQMEISPLMLELAINPPHGENFTMETNYNDENDVE